MNIVLKGVMAFDGFLGRMWDTILYTPPPQPPPPKVFVDPSGKYMRAHLAEWLDSHLYKEQYHLKVDEVTYHVLYIPLRSTYYSVAYYYNKQKLPALGAFIRGKKDIEAMRDFIKMERIRKKKESLKIDLREKHRHHRH